MITMQGGNFVPVPFVDVVDPDSGRTRVRMVDIHSTRYGIARRYMIRLRRDDFEDPHELACSRRPRESRSSSSATSSNT